MFGLGALQDSLEETEHVGPIRLSAVGFSLLGATAVCLATSTSLAAPPTYRLERIPLPDSPLHWYSGFADKINNRGDVMGKLNVFDDDEQQHTFFYRNGSVIDINPEPYYVRPSDMNASGNIVGSVEGSEAFVYIDGHFSPLPSGAYVPQQASAINNNNQVIGVGYVKATGMSRAFLWEKGVVKPLPFGPFVGHTANAINIHGDIVGAGFTADDKTNAMLYRDGVTRDLGHLPASDYTYALFVSADGVVAGGADYPYPSERKSAFRYADGVMKDIGTLGGERTFVVDMNDVGDIVGVSDTATGSSHAFVYDGMSFIDIGTLGVSSIATRITNNGQICGVYELADGSDRSFIYGANANVAYDLRSRVADGDPLKPYVQLLSPSDINAYGQIVVVGFDTRDGRYNGYIVSPIDSTKPVIVSKLTGTRGKNGWYTGNVAVTWKVTDTQAPIGSSTGCDPANVTSDSKNVKFSCKASSIGGTATKAVTVKRDSVPPTAAISRPASGVRYARNQRVLASYACADETSGVMSCTGPVANGAAIDTSARVTNRPFAVSATDKAGTLTTLTVTYSVR